MSDPLALPRLFATPAGVRLIGLEMIKNGQARNVVLQLGDKGRFHGIVVRLGDAVKGYVDQYPHAGLPLAKTIDGYMAETGGLIACAWHGALFDPQRGLCVGGPCVGARLTPWAVEVVEGVIFTAAAKQT